MSVQQAGLNLNNSYLNTNPFMQTNLSGFNFSGINSDYENDLLMPDYLKVSSPAFQAGIQGVGAQVTEGGAQSVFTAAQNQNTQEQVELPQLTESQPKNTNIFKILGGALGISAPAVAAYFAKSAVSWKALAIKSPLLGIAGYALGALADGLINSSKNNSAA